MKKLITLPLIAMVFCSVGFTAPLCSTVLKASSALSQNETDVIIQNIAEMKLQADLAKSAGMKTPATTAFLKNFPAKYQELVTKLQGKISEGQLREMIAKKIAQLQGRKHEDTLKTEKDRAHQEKIIRSVKSFLFELKEKGMGYEGSTSGQPHFIFLPQLESISVFTGQTLVTFNYRIGKNEYSVPAEAGALLSNKNTILLKDGDQLVEFDPATVQIMKRQNIQFLAGEVPHIEFAKLQVTKSGMRVLITGEAEDGTATMSLIDRESGKELLSRKEMPSDFKYAALLNDKELVIVRADNRVERIEMESGLTVQSTVIPFTKAALAPPQLSVSSDGKVVTAINKHEIFSVEAKDLDKPLSYSDVSAPQVSWSRSIVSADSYPTAFLEGDFYAGAKLFSMHPLKVEFDFENQYGQDKKQILGISMSPEGDRIMILYSKSSSGTRGIDIWHRQELNIP